MIKFANPFAKPAPPAAPSRFEDGRVGYAIGDIHGRADLLERMLGLLEHRMADEMREAGPPIVVFLGDYVDRGPDSNKVLNMLLGNRPVGYERRYLKGNHEQAMLAFFAEPMGGRDWISYGGLETLVSYGVSPVPFLGASEEVWLEAAESLRQKLPADHLAFLQNLERYAQYGDYAFVHAGVNSARALDDQEDRDLFWIRDRFLHDKTPLPYRVVHGHTPSDKPFMDARRIGLDTGAYASGRLTAARFEGEDVQFIEVSV